MGGSPNRSRSERATMWPTRSASRSRRTHPTRQEGLVWVGGGFAEPTASYWWVPQSVHPPYKRSPMRRTIATSLIALFSSLAVARADDWPQWFGPKRDGVWREDGILEKFPADGPKQLWKTPIGAGYTGPAVAG